MMKTPEELDPAPAPERVELTLVRKAYDVAGDKSARVAYEVQLGGKVLGTLAIGLPPHRRGCGCNIAEVIPKVLLHYTVQTVLGPPPDVVPAEAFSAEEKLAVMLAPDEAAPGKPS